jgi:3-oxoadipate enol-lactonase
MQTVINDVTLAYMDRGSGLALVFLHAFPLNRMMWQPQEQALASAFRIVSIDLRGHGESDAPLWHYSLEQAADDVCGLLDYLSITQAVFVGLSMGGYILFTLYRNHPQRVKGLVLADTRPQADSQEGRRARFQMAQTAYTQGAGAVADLMLPKLLSAETIRKNPKLVQQVRSMIEGTQISGIAGALMAMAERADSMALLSQINCPTQVVVGERDVATPLSDATIMADRIPGARLAVIPEAGHLSNLEQPDRFNDIVRMFASGLPPA